MSQKCFANVNEAPMLLKSCFVIMSLSCWAKWEIYICIGVSPSVISHGGFFPHIFTTICFLLSVSDGVILIKFHG